MVSDYLLGIDGGASKTEFSLARQSFQEIKRVIVNTGSNPWHRNISQTKETLDKGLGLLGKSLLEKVSFAYAGISGCFGDGKYNPEIKSFLERRIKRVAVGGDLYSSFRSLSQGRYGIIAIAGTGSSIAEFNQKGKTHFLDGPAYGSRDFGHSLCQSLLSSNFENRKKAKKIITEFLGRKKPTFDQPIKQWTNNKRMIQLAEMVGSLEENCQAFKEFKVFIDTAVGRWVHKIVSFAYKFSYEEKKNFELVLSGGFWNFNYVRINVINLLKVSLPQAEIRYSKNIRPVEGCLKIAKDYSASLPKKGC